MLKINVSIFYSCLTTIITFDGVFADCPNDTSLLSPCTCESGLISCVDTTGAQLKKIFNKLDHLEDGEKHFHGLTISGPGCDELLEHTFADITFDNIDIKDAPNFKAIHKNAFLNTHLVLGSFLLHNLPSLDVSNLFEIINKFRQIYLVDLANLAKLETIPSLAFKTLRKFIHLILNGNNIKKINEKAFFNLNSLSRLDIIHTSLDSIGPNIFVFSQDSPHTLTLGLYGNQHLNCNSFTPETFSKAKRVLSLDFSGYHYVEHPYRKQFTCMPEQVFRPFLEADSSNDIDFYELDFDCNDCKNSWLKNETQFHERLTYIECQNGTKLDDDANFKGC